MARSFARFMIGETAAVAALNAGCNAALAAWTWSSVAQPGLAADSLLITNLSLTPVFIAFLTTLFGTASARRRIDRGTVLPPRRSLAMLARLPHATLKRAGLLALISCLFLALPLAVLLPTVNVARFTSGQAVVAKVVITIIASCAIAPLAALSAVRPSRRIGERVDMKPGLFKTIALFRVVGLRA